MSAQAAGPTGEQALAVGERGLLIAASHPATVARLVRERCAVHHLALREVVPAAATVLIELERADDLPTLRDLLARLDNGGGQSGSVVAFGSDPDAADPHAADPDAADPDAADPHAADPDASPITIEVTFDGADLSQVAASAGMSVAEVVQLMLDTTFSAEFTGFAPGFAYLSGLPPHLHLPRRAEPRTRVPAGSLAIADRHTAVYPAASPGGWHLLGSTRQLMFDPTRSAPALVTPGATVRFTAQPQQLPHPQQPRHSQQSPRPPHLP